MNNLTDIIIGVNPEKLDILPMLPSYYISKTVHYKFKVPAIRISITKV